MHIYGDDIIKISNNSSFKVVLIMKYSSKIKLNKISIDDSKTFDFIENRKGVIFEAEHNIFFEFISEQKEFVDTINFWVIPSNICSTSCKYSYGSRNLEYESSNDYFSYEICVFSPTFDSKTNEYKVKFGTKTYEDK